MIGDIETLDKTALCYKNNINLKAANVNMSFTNEQIEEFTKCKLDMKYFIRNYVKIINMDKGKILFDMYPFQEEMLDLFNNNRYSLAVTGRQQGKCVSYDTKIHIKNKNTNYYAEVSIGGFYDICKNTYKTINFEHDVKFIQQINLNDFEVLTENGWKPIVAMFKTIKYERYEVEFHDGKILRCADDHILINEHNEEVFVKDLKKFDKIKNDTNSFSVVKKIRNTLLKEHMYDLQIDSDSHLYYTNGLLSHNTTVVAAYLLHQAVFNDDKRIAILANKAETARNILGKLKLMFEELPWYMKPGVVEWNKGRITLSNGTVVLSAATSSASIRGESINIVYLDEFAFVENDIEFYTSTYPVITSGKNTKVIITSTPKGMNLFYKIYVDSLEGRNAFKSKKFTWECHPDRDQQWKEETLSNIGEFQFKQEYECEFFGSSNTLINGETLKQMNFINPISINDNKTLMIYEEPKENHQYVLTCDVSEGLGKDYSVISVFDVTSIPYKHIALYRNSHIHPTEFASIINNLGKKYNDGFVLIENNSIGKMTADTLYFEFEYENLLTNALTKDDSYISNKGSIPWIGIRTTKKTKQIGCSNLKHLIENKLLITHDFDTINEFSTFSKYGNTFKAEHGKNDDIVMTFVLFAWLASQDYFKDLTDTNYINLLKENMEKYEDELNSAFIFVNDGIHSHEDEVINLF